MFRRCLPPIFLAFSSQAVYEPAQTPWQRELFENVSRRAAELSEAAVPQLLQELASPPFRAKLAQCCPEASVLSAEELLVRLQEEAAVAEIASGFAGDASSWYGFQDMNIADGMASAFFLNLWAVSEVHKNGFPTTIPYSYRDTCDLVAGKGARTIWTSTTDCNGGTSKPIVQEYVNGACDLNFGPLSVILRTTCDSQNTILAFWLNFSAGEGTSLAELDTKWLRSRSRTGDSERNSVECPLGEPNYVEVHPTDSCANGAVPYGYWRVAEYSERNIYGFRPFSAWANPRSLDETLERGFYASVNRHLVDMGSPLFGQVSAVFSQRAMRKSALVSAVDSGYVTSYCNASDGGPSDFPPGLMWPNCTAYQRFDHLGTMEHFNHLFLINRDFWNNKNGADPLLLQIARLESSWGSAQMTTAQLLHYWEAMPAATMYFPQDVRFLIGSFPELFGSKTGSDLQKWASSRGWILVWSLGANFKIPVTWENAFIGTWPLPLNQRLVDPLVAQQTSAKGDLPLAQVDMSAFSRQWEAVETLRNSNVQIANTTWAKLWGNLTDSMPVGMRVSPLRAGRCPRPSEDAPECIGISGDGKCVCYSDTFESEAIVI